MRGFAFILLLLALALSGLFLHGSSSSPKAQQSRQHSSPSKVGYFDYADAAHGIKVRVFLPESMGEWAVENPWRDAERSLAKEPQVFVKANFQSVNVPSFYGLVRVVFDLQGYDCGAVFSKLAQLDGLKLEKYSDTSFEGIQNGKLYIFEYLEPAKNLVVGSKVLCDDKTAVEVMVVSPNEKKYSGDINLILKTVEATIPATPAK